MILFSHSLRLITKVSTRKPQSYSSIVQLGSSDRLGYLYHFHLWGAQRSRMFRLSSRIDCFFSSIILSTPWTPPQPWIIVRFGMILLRSIHFPWVRPYTGLNLLVAQKHVSIDGCLTQRCVELGCLRRSMSTISSGMFECPQDETSNTKEVDTNPKDCRRSADVFGGDCLF